MRLYIFYNPGCTDSTKHIHRDRQVNAAIEPVFRCRRRRHRYRYHLPLSPGQIGESIALQSQQMDVNQALMLPAGWNKVCIQYQIIIITPRRNEFPQAGPVKLLLARYQPLTIGKANHQHEPNQTDGHSEQMYCLFAHLRKNPLLSANRGASRLVRSSFLEFILVHYCDNFSDATKS